MSTKTKIAVDEKTKLNKKEPRRYKVIMINDDQTPMDFVVSLLVDLFKHSEQSATVITTEIHDNGAGVVGVYSHEIAEQKVGEATRAAQENGFPLRLKIEEDK